MCRISGIIDRSLTGGDLQHKVSRMCQALKAGGPDDEGVYYNEANNLVFGHRRLSIIELNASGHQPMVDTEQRAWITFNGEIYNYRELRAELTKLGYTFLTRTDTEVILAAYLKWGVGGFSRLRGMFAFALFDSVMRHTYLVRDTAAIKPLYYCTKNGHLSFASETRAFVAAGIATDTDPNWTARFMAYGHLPEPYTHLKHVFCLPKGNYLRWDHNSDTYTIAAYPKRPLLSKITDAVEARLVLKNAFDLSISRQMIADAPLGVFLSGGIDSSLITLIASQQNKESLKSVSICFDDKAYDERAFQQLILQKTGIDNRLHLVTQKDFTTLFPQFMDAVDIPTIDGVNSWFISKYAHENGLKAVLSGIGADEYFGGYPSFSRIKYLQYIRHLPSAALSVFHQFLPDSYKKVSYLSHQSAAADFLSLRGFFSLEEIARILNATTNEVKNILFESETVLAGNMNALEYASRLEVDFYMQNQLLRDADVMSMSHGLEVRVPFLDEDFTDLIESFSPGIRFDAQKPKSLLIDSYAGLLPEAVWNRPKMGFAFPLQQWMSNYQPISEESLYKGAIVKNTIREFKKNRVHWSKAFALYQIRDHV